MGAISDCLHLKVSLKKEKIIYMLNLLPKGVQIIKTFLIGFFSIQRHRWDLIKERIRDKSTSDAADTAGRVQASRGEGAEMEFKVGLQSSTLHLKGTFNPILCKV
jgi:hypothetical protein